MIIDASYFYGDLDIAQKSFGPVSSNLNWFINQYEPVFLLELMGYELYTAFQAGIIVMPTPDPKWTDLLYGAAYTNRQNKPDRWKGLVRSQSGNTISIFNQNQIDIVVGRGGAYDPVPGSTTTIIPAALAGLTFVFQQRGFGPFRSDEYSVTGNMLTLLGGNIFSIDDTYFYYGNTTGLAASVNTDKQSPIANFIYYWYLRNNATTTAGSGEAGNNVSAPVSPKTKMVRAWNQMAEWNLELVEFLLSNMSVYTEFTYFGFNFFGIRAIRKQQNLLTRINLFGF